MLLKRSKRRKKGQRKSVVDMKIFSKAQAAVYIKMLHNVEDSTGVELFSEEMDEKSKDNIFVHGILKPIEQRTSFTQIVKKDTSFAIRDREVLDFPNPRLATA